MLYQETKLHSFKIRRKKNSKNNSTYWILHISALKPSSSSSKLDKIPEKHMKVYDVLIARGYGSNYTDIIRMREKIEILNNLARANRKNPDFDRSDPALFLVNITSEPRVHDFLLDGDMHLRESLIDNMISGYLQEPVTYKTNGKK